MPLRRPASDHLPPFFPNRFAPIINMPGSRRGINKAGQQEALDPASGLPGTAVGWLDTFSVAPAAGVALTAGVLATGVLAGPGISALLSLTMLPPLVKSVLYCGPDNS